MQGILKKIEKRLFRSFNFTFLFSIFFLYRWYLITNNSKFGDYVDRIYFIKLEIKDTTNTARSVLYILTFILEITSEGPLRTKHYDKRDDFISGTHRIKLDADPLKSHEWRNDGIVITTKETYSWSFMIQIFHNG